MKVSLAYVFIAASIVVVVNSEINPRHRFLKAKASKVSQTKASKSKSSKSDIDRCADVDCSTFDTGDTCFNGAVCNPDTGLCEGVPDNEFLVNAVNVFAVRMVCALAMILMKATSVLSLVVMLVQ